MLLLSFTALLLLTAGNALMAWLVTIDEEGLRVRR